MNDISVIIPVYNVEPYVEGCLRSVIKQNGVDNIRIECLVVDDRGSDNSMDIVRNIIEDYSGPISFRIIEREKNGGLSAARNTGLREANGKYVYFLDSDDTISPECLSSLWQYVVEFGCVDLVFGKTVCVPDSRFRESYFDFSRCVDHVFYGNIQDVRRVYPSLPEIACNKLIKRSWLAENGLYFREQIIHEDLHWHLMSLQYVKSFVVVPTGSSPSYYYLQREGSIMHVNINERWIRNLYKIYLEITQKNSIWPKALMTKLIIYYFDLLSMARINADAELSPFVLVSNLSNCNNLCIKHRVLVRYLSLFRFKANIRIALRLC